MKRPANSLILSAATGLVLFVVFILVCTTQSILAQDTAKETVNRDTLISAARDVIETAQFCALITLDQTGHPQARTMQPFQPDEQMVVWFATNPKSRKAREIENDKRVTLYYGDPSGNGYVVITGNAYLVNDPAEKAKRWMESWEDFYPDRDESYLLIRVIPDKLEIVSYKHGLTGDSITWRAPNIDFQEFKK